MLTVFCLPGLSPAAHEFFLVRLFFHLSKLLELLLGTSNFLLRPFLSLGESLFIYDTIHRLICASPKHNGFSWFVSLRFFSFENPVMLPLHYFFHLAIDLFALVIAHRLLSGFLYSLRNPRSYIISILTYGIHSLLLFCSVHFHLMDALF
jgi:hypothetical protein